MDSPSKENRPLNQLLIDLNSKSTLEVLLDSLRIPKFSL